jgi:type II secretory pathway pseudopilin PulG
MTPNGIQRRDSAIRSTPDRSAYTLIELLIAAVLTATLMTVIWGLLSMYNAWLTAGRVQSEERQLRRSLMALLQDDLESVALLDSGRKVQFLESAADVIATDVERKIRWRWRWNRSWRLRTCPSGCSHWVCRTSRGECRSFR